MRASTIQGAVDTWQYITNMSEMLSSTGYRLTEHARFEMKRRYITEAEVAQVLSAPDQEAVVRPGRMVYQSRVEKGKPAQTYLLRVFIDVDREPPVVDTVYRTSKIEKYWRTEK